MVKSCVCKSQDFCLILLADTDLHCTACATLPAKTIYPASSLAFAVNYLVKIRRIEKSKMDIFFVAYSSTNFS